MQLYILPRSYLAPVLAFVFAQITTSQAIGAEKTGEQLYRKLCASCHGDAGEGTKENYKKPLTGDRSVAQLANLITRTMPKDDPGSCVGAEAEKVAIYMNESFYSKEARERNSPPRVELSRLTVQQYQNTIADLIAGFRTPGRWDDKHGLRGEYFDGRDFRNNKRLIDRTDPEVQFNFGTTGPTEKFTPNQFLIRWEGSVLAPETGSYEFIVRTEHALRLWVNNNRTPVIDAWVKSGTDTEFKVSLFLVAGRAYPLKLEFSKAKQGVDDSNKNTKPPPVKATIALLWKPPQRQVEVIPARNLTPNRFPETCTVETPFPPDDRSLGWVRGTTISKAWDQATTEGAIETANYVVAHLAELTGTREDAKDRVPKLREFCRKFVERAFRLPVSDEQKRQYVDRQFEATPDAEVAVKRVVLLVMKSPRFLYREIDGGPEPYNVAARLSYSLWDSLPDEELLNAAATAKLATREQIAKQAERMLMDTRARTKLGQFLFQWLKLDQAPEIAKDPMRLPGFDTSIIADLRTSLELFLDEVVWSDNPDFRRLLLANELYLNGRLAKYYGAELPTDAPFQKVKLNADERAGVLTHPYLMATFSYSASTSPIHRGVFLTRGVLGVGLRPPQEAFTPLSADLHPDLTTRERVALQTKSASCQTCHAIINPLGFSLENFDAVGRFREEDNGKPVDASGGYETRRGKIVEFNGARELAIFLASSEEVQQSFTEQMFQHLAKQPIRAYGPRQLPELRLCFAESRFNIRKLAIEIATTTALKSRAGDDRR